MLSLLLFLSLNAGAESWVKAPGGTPPAPPITVYSSQEFCGDPDCVQLDPGVDADTFKVQSGKGVLDTAKKAAKDAAKAQTDSDEAAKETKAGQRLTALKACLQLVAPTAAELRSCLQLVIKETLRNKLSNAEQ